MYKRQEQGRAGGIYVMKGYRLDGRYLSADEQAFLERLAGALSGEDRAKIESIIKKFGLQEERK